MGTLSTLLKGFAIIRANRAKIEELKKGRQTKLNKLAIYMLGGRPVTGAIMIAKFNIYSYRDAIYDLTKKGYEIKNKDITTENGVTHRIWWLAEFDEEFALAREKKFLGIANVNKIAYFCLTNC